MEAQGHTPAGSRTSCMRCLVFAGTISSEISGSAPISLGWDQRWRSAGESRGFVTVEVLLEFAPSFISSFDLVVSDPLLR